MSTVPHPRSSLRRTACDRCRHSKLKCFRDENQLKCARCLRLELRCEVAPAKPPGRPRKVPLAPAVVPESTDNIDITSPQLLEDGSQSTAEEGAECSFSQSPNPTYDLQPELFGHDPLTSQNNMNNLFLTLMPQISESRTPEWYETSCFGPGLAPIRDPLEVHSLFTAKLDREECLKELSQLNVDLHVLVLALQDLEANDKLDFATFCAHPPPPEGDSVSFAEKFLIMSQRFQQAITNLCWVVKHDPRPLPQTAPAANADELPLDPLLNIEGPLPSCLNQQEGDNQVAPNDDDPSEHGEPLETPFACLIVSCYVQLIGLWETMWQHVRARTSGIDRSELTLSDPSKGLQMGAFYVFSGRLQSMFFCQAVLYFLDNIDRGLGIQASQREQGVRGLLTHPRHFGLLHRELGAREGEGESGRVRALKELVEKTRVCTLEDVGCSLFRSS